MSLIVSVMITTKNRALDLKQTCENLRKLSPSPTEILITADGCSDNTVELVKRAMPAARLIINKEGRGSVASRDRMMREAKGDLVFSLDDDSYPEQVDCLSFIGSQFENNAKLAVLHFPQRTDEYPETLTQTGFGGVRLTRSFPNSGSVLRRSTYLKLAGFESRFVHAYEEPDYALQCVAAGYEVVYSPEIKSSHHYSRQNRNEIRVHHRHSRNELWSTVMRCPLPQMPFVAVYRIFSQFRYACKRGPSWCLREPIWWWQALQGLRYCLEKRKPVSWQSYKSWLQLN